MDNYKDSNQSSETNSNEGNSASLANYLSREGNRLRIIRLDKKDFGCHEFISEVSAIISPFYEDITALLERELSHCNVGWGIRDVNGKLLSFAMFAYEDLEVENDGSVPCLYVGLAATHQKYQKRGFIHRLWLAASIDLQQRQQSLCRPLIAWATTASPDAYFGAVAFSDVNPSLTAEYSAESLKYVRAIRAKLGLANNSPEHPYILRGIALNTRYSGEERNRIEVLSRRKNFLLFDALDIDETKGDRLLMIGMVKPIPTPSLKLFEKQNLKG